MNEDNIEKIIEQCVILSKTDEKSRGVYYFEPQGASTSSILSESHLNFHISPEESERYVQADISTCGQYTLPLRIVNFLLGAYLPERARLKYEYLGFKHIKGIFPDDEVSFIEQVAEGASVKSMNGKPVLVVERRIGLYEKAEYEIVRIGEVRIEDLLREFYAELVRIK